MFVTSKGWKGTAWRKPSLQVDFLGVRAHYKRLCVSSQDGRHHRGRGWRQVRIHAVEPKSLSRDCDIFAASKPLGELLSALLR